MTSLHTSLRPSLRRTSRSLVALTLLAASGCAQPQAVVSPEPLPELAQTAAPLGDDEVALPKAPASPDATPAPAEAPTASEPTGTEAPVPGSPGTGDGPDPEPANEPGEETSETAPASPPRFLADVTDRRGDAGVEGPRWADLTRLAVLSAGTELVVVVELADAAPEVLDEGEVVGIGVDLFRPGAGESGYQLFVDGGSDGWRAYLQTPEGFVAYPGTFSRGGSRLELRVPWTAVGDPAEAEVRTFLDWSKRALVTNLVARDDVPDGGRVAVRR